MSIDHTLVVSFVYWSNILLSLKGTNKCRNQCTLSDKSTFSLSGERMYYGMWIVWMKLVADFDVRVYQILNNHRIPL